MGMEVDNISELPGHVIDQILSHLSLKDAVRTSILSNNWRYKWAFLVNLVFDHLVLEYSRGSTKKPNELVDIVNRVFSIHSGPINKFKVYNRNLKAVQDIDRWILFLSTRSVKEFILNIFGETRYSLPSTMFSFGSLIHLELHNCVIEPPATFSGFKSLKSLKLRFFSMCQDDLEKLIYSCILLEQLTLVYFDGFSHLNIRAPNLMFIEVYGSFDDVNLENAPNLSNVYIGLSPGDTYQSIGVARNLIRFFSSLPHVQRLELKGLYFQNLAVGVVPKWLPCLCMKLNHLSLDVDLNETEGYRATLCILRSSPNLQELKLSAAYPHIQEEEEEDYFNGVNNDVERDRSYLFDNLRLVTMSGISGSVLEEDFIEILLKSSPMLQRITIMPTYPDRWDRVKRYVQHLQASSVQRPEIIYQDPMLEQDKRLGNRVRNGLCTCTN